MTERKRVPPSENATPGAWLVGVAVAELKRMVETSADAAALRSTLDAALQDLRLHWRAQRKAFSDDDVGFLEWAGDVADALHRFQDLEEELDAVRDLVDYEELMPALRAIVEQLDGLPVAAHARRRAKDLEDRLPALRKVADQQRDDADARVLRALEAQAGTCPNGHRYVLREGVRGMFWGCSLFPKCWARRGLTRAEKAQLPS